MPPTTPPALPTAELDELITELEYPALNAAESGFKQVTVDVDHVLSLLASARQALALEAFLREHGEETREALVHYDDGNEDGGNPVDTVWGKRLAAFDALLSGGEVE